MIPITAYVAAGALAAGIAAGFGASHFLVVVPMELRASQDETTRAQALTAATQKARQTEQETQDGLQTLVGRYMVATHDRAALDAQLVGLRHAADATPANMPEVHSASGGPATCPDILAEISRRTDGLDSATREVAQRAADAVDACESRAKSCGDTLDLAQGSLRACAALTRGTP